MQGSIIARHYPPGTSCTPLWRHSPRASVTATSSVPQHRSNCRQGPRRSKFRLSRSADMRSHASSAAAGAASQASAGSSSDAEVVICGAGIIGAATAYFLTQRGIKPLVIERTGVAAAASGKAGGFLARAWGDGSETQQLHHASFDLHASLAEELKVTSYRRIPTLSIAGGRSRGRNGSRAAAASWLDGDVSKASMMDPNTAQVTPKEITSKLMEAAVANGARLEIGTVVGIDTAAADKGGQSSGPRIAGVRFRSDGAVTTVATSKLLVAMGPWSVLAEDWLADTYAAFPDLPRLHLPIEGVKSTSIVYYSDHLRQRVAAEPFALFCAEDRNGCHLEVYPRHDGETYICGCGGSDYVSGDRLREGGDCEHQGLVHADPKRAQAASASFAGLTTLAREPGSQTPLPPDRTQACMRPCAKDALPIMGEVPGVQGMHIATAHNCWGILWGPISGLAMSELLVDGHSASVDLSAFSPSRFVQRRKTGTRGRHAGQVAVGEQW